MRKAVIAVVLALSLTVGAATAGAHGARHLGWGGGQSGPRAAVAGTVVSVDAAAGTIVADAYVLTPPSFTGYPGHRGPGYGGPGGNGQGGDGRGWGFGHRLSPRWSSTGTAPAAPTTTQVTITTNPGTKIAVNGHPEAIGDIAAADKFVALFSGSSSDTIQTLTANPALAVFAHTPPTPKQLYAFVGTVTGVSATSSPETVTVTVANSYPSGLFTSPATFTVGPSTAILGGSSASGNGLFGGSLSDVAVGDTVAGGLVAPAGETATQVEALPLAVLLDFPAASGTVSSAAKASALKSTLALFGVRDKGKHKARGRHHKKK